MAVTSVRASISIFGGRRSHTAAAVTQLLGIEPTTSREAGDPHPSKSMAAKGKVVTECLWVFGEERTIAADEDPQGMESLVRLTERFEPKSAALAELRSQGYKITVTMTGSSDSTQGGFYVGPDTMRRLGLLSASFSPSVWLDDGTTAEEYASW